VGKANKIAVVLSDLHIPFEDKKLVKNILSFIKDICPQKLILNGDLLDFFSLSKFDKSKSRAESLQYEIDSACVFFMTLRRHYKGDILYVMGNHEKRLKKFLNGTNLKALRELNSLKFENLLRLNEYNITLIDYAYNIGPLMIKHGDSCTKNCAQKEIMTELKSGLSGHSHRSNRAVLSGFQDEYFWYTCGHLSNWNLLEYAKSFRWNQSFFLVEYNNKWFNVEEVHCKGASFYCKYNRKHYGKIK
jgi:UDP-2,3-diacylglucosamine pyrophosphatase LpxH